MINDESESGEAFKRGERESLIESFSIRKLYGYRSINLKSNFAATILIARNGTGKTTLLGALDAFLRLQFSRLRNLDFSDITCKFRGSPELVITHDEILEFLQVPPDGELKKLATRAEIDVSKLFTFLLEEAAPDYRDTDLFRNIVRVAGYNLREAHAVCQDVRRTLFERQTNVALIAKTVDATLKDYDIVYLPTYRRIEIALTDEGAEAPYRRRRKQPKLSVAAGSLFKADIRFGLSDISDRLNDLNNQIVFDSDSGYRNISANIINDLIEGAFESQDEAEQYLPTKDELKLFFSRLEQRHNIGPFPPVSIPNIDKIYLDNAIPESSEKFLRYFLGQLSTVIAASRSLEAPVYDFVDNCNRYLLSGEPSTDHPKFDVATKQFGKELKLNRHNLRVNVVSVPEQRKISLDALSSGEKQMISLFAKLFLYPGRKIVLVDEPELSLSIDWQKRILVDVINSPLCEQVIAITHSPFIFDNELEPFARSLDVRSDSSESVSSGVIDDEDHLDV